MNPGLEQLEATLRLDYLSFLQKSFATLHPGQKLDATWLHEAMAYALQQCGDGSAPRLIVTMPPRSLKSITFSVAWTAYLLGLNPTTKIMCASYNDDLAKRHSIDTRRIMQAPWYRKLFPGTVLVKQTETDLETSQGGRRTATSVGGTITGFGAEWIIVDDPLKADEALSKTARDKVNSWFVNTVISRFDNKLIGKIVLVMQRLHEEDLAGFLLEKGSDWRELRLPAIADEDSETPIGPGEVHTRKVGDLLQPDREPLHVLMRDKAMMGSALFQAQYQQSPTPDEGNMIKREWLRYYGVQPDLSGARISLSLDTAQKTEPSNDFSVLTVWAMIGDNHYLIDVVRGRWDYPKLKAEVIAQWNLRQPERLLIEDTGSGTGLIQDLRQSGQGMNIVPIQAKEFKGVRLGWASALIEGGRMLLPKEADWLQQCLTELLGFPSARHDDIVDSISQYLNWARSDSAKGTFDVGNWGQEGDITVETAVSLYAAQLRAPFGRF